MESVQIANAWAKPKVEENFPMPGDNSYNGGNSRRSDGYSGGAPAAAASARPAPPAPPSGPQPIANDMFGDLDFGVDVHGGDEFDDGFDF